MRQVEMRLWRLDVLLAMAAVCLGVGLSGCGGGSDSASEAPPPPPPTAIGADGGKVEVPGVATVVVPPGALDAQTTIRVAQDSSAAPPVPAWFMPAGPMVAITPHGASFPEPVTVRLPAPSITLQDNERLLLAKAQPGGEWEVFSDTVLKDGQLEIQVNSFSTFVPVRVPFTVSSLGPFAMSATTLTCDGRPCAARERLRPMLMTATTTGNGGTFPTGCVNPKLTMLRARSSGTAAIGTSEDAAAAVVFRRSFTMPTTLDSFPYGGRLVLLTQLICTDAQTNAWSSLTMSQVTQFVDDFGHPGPGLAVVEFPATLTQAVGESTTVRAVLKGGAFPGAPTAADEARVFFERLAPGDSAWRVVSERGQTSASPNPYGGPNWRYWSFDYAIGPFTTADSGTSYRARVCYREPGSSTNHCVIGPVATLTIVQQAQAPSFIAQPRAVLIQPGQTASFNAQVTGTPAPTLQWQMRASGSTGNWTDVPTNGNAVNYTTPPISLADNGLQYRLMATNGAGSVASDIVTVSVSATLVPPAIGTQPASLSVVRGSEALFAVNATGTEALSYQWFKGGVAITGANAPQLKIGNVADANAGSYSVEVSNAAGRVASTSAQLTVTTAVPTIVAPAIVTQPAAVIVTEGHVATFAVGVTGSGPMSFQWRKNGVDITGATAAAYTLPAVAMADDGNYSVRVSNGAGSVTSQSATLAVARAGGTPLVQPPTIVANQDGIVVALGMDAMFGVEAQGSGPLAYRWLRNGVPVPGQDAAIYVINGATAMDAGSYQVEVSNSAGTVTSATSRVVLLGAPAITSQPAAASQPEGTTAQFNVAATGDALRYQWLRNHGAIAGATDSLYTTPTLTLADSGAVYSVIVYNGTSLVFSGGAVLTVTPEVIAPTVTLQPSDLTVNEGTPAGIEYSFGGTAPFTMQLERLSAGGWTVIAGPGPLANNAVWRTYTGNLALADSGSMYRVVATNAAGSATTRAATVTVVGNLPADALLATQVTTLANRTLAVHPNGNVYAWGTWVDPLTGGYTPNGTWARQPVRVQGLGPVRQVAIGSDFASWALAADGTVWGWGYLNSTQAFAQGPGSTVLSFLAPVPLLESANTPIDRVCQIEGTTYGVVMVRSEVVGGTCAADERRSVWYTASISGRETTSSSYAVRYSALDSGGTLLPQGRWVKEIVTSRNHGGNQSSVFAIANDGSVYAWGYLNSQGQLGLGNNSTQPATPQPAPGWQGALKIAAAGEVTLALMADGSIKGAGWNPSASLGVGPVSFAAVTTPTTLAGMAGAGDVSTASNNSGSMALVAGQLRYWGSNTQFDAAIQAAPIAIATPATPLTSVAVGGRHAVAIGPGNAVYSWGDPSYRGCALGSSTCSASTAVPMLVTVP